MSIPTNQKNSSCKSSYTDWRREAFILQQTKKVSSVDWGKSIWNAATGRGWSVPWLQHLSANRRTPATLQAPACWRGAKATASLGPVYTVTKEKEKGIEVSSKTAWLSVITPVWALISWKGSEKIITRFWVPFCVQWKTALDSNRMVMGGCLSKCDGEVLNATWRE